MRRHVSEIVGYRPRCNWSGCEERSQWRVTRRTSPTARISVRRLCPYHAALWCIGNSFPPPPGLRIAVQLVQQQQEVQ